MVGAIEFDRSAMLSNYQDAIIQEQQTCLARGIPLESCKFLDALNLVYSNAKGGK
jgi:hypothetical protein